jgi:ubiquinone/menaquinone biosynthesis C-methylase UbiE/uncharacterized protein YbaR (Trm112 family)
MTRVTHPAVQPASPGFSPVQNELLSLLVCPESGLPLTGWEDAARHGSLLCEATGQTYAVRDGIPNLLPTALQAGDARPEPENDGEVAEKQREMAARDAQVTAYDGMLGLRLFTSVEVPLTLRYLWPEPGHLMLEGGCGTGRMTAAFAERVRGLLCVDFSFESLRVARQKLPPHLRNRVLFVQADLSQLPLRPASFDRVGSFGVYEHIPTPEARRRALSEMARVVKPRSRGGRFALSAYRWGAPQSWMSEREGHHDGGIYFVRLTMDELKEQVAAHFDVRQATEALLYYHLLWGRKWEPPTHPA